MAFGFVRRKKLRAGQVFFHFLDSWYCHSHLEHMALASAKDREALVPADTIFLIYKRSFKGMSFSLLTSGCCRGSRVSGCMPCPMAKLPR